MERARPPQEVVRAAGLGHDLETLGLEDARDPLAEEHVVLTDHHAQRHRLTVRHEVVLAVNDGHARGHWQCPRAAGSFTTPLSRKERIVELRQLRYFVAV